MPSPDIINSAFLILGSFFVILSIIKAWRTREIRGINPLTPAFFLLWSIWNVYFFFTLAVWISFFASIAFMLVNAVWLYLVFKFGDK